MHRKIEETPEREKMLIRLKELRLERGYSMTQAARKIFSHPDTYNRYEKGIREIPLDSLMQPSQSRHRLQRHAADTGMYQKYPVQSSSDKEELPSASPSIFSRPV